MIVDATLASQSTSAVHMTTTPVWNIVPSDNVSPLAMHATIYTPNSDADLTHLDELGCAQIDILSPGPLEI